jgi:hypothetical protein
VTICGLARVLIVTCENVYDAYLSSIVRGIFSSCVANTPCGAATNWTTEVVRTHHTVVLIYGGCPVQQWASSIHSRRASVVTYDSSFDFDDFRTLQLSVTARSVA